MANGVAVDDVLPRELVEPNVDPPPVTPNLNFGAVAFAPDDSAGNGAEALEVPNSNAVSVGLADSVLAVEVDPVAELDAKLAGLLENPKLNLGAGAVVVDTGATAGGVFCGVLVLPKIDVDFADALVVLAGSLAVPNEPKTDEDFAGSLAVLDKPNTEVGLVVSDVDDNKLKADVGFVDSAEDLSVFPNVNLDPLSTGANDCEVLVL